MRTLFPASFNWGIFLLVAIVLRGLFPQWSIYSYFAIVFSIYEFCLLFTSIGHILPTRYIFGLLMCVQFFVGPALAYNGLDQYQYFKYRMRIPEEEYFLYAIPAVLAFIAGLHFNAGKYKGEIIDKEGVAHFVDTNPLIPYIFLGIGFASSIVAGFFSSDLSFVFYLLGGFKFIGLFLLVLGTRQLKLIWMIVVVGSIIGSSMGSGMFHDLLTWIIFTGAIFAIKYQFSFKIKIIGTVLFFLMIITIQLLKGQYRQTLSGERDGSLETFTELAIQENENKDLFNLEKLARSNVRINQGFIITNIMTVVPAREPFANGEELGQIVEAAVMPRFLAPDKLRAGDRSIFVKYSGIPLTQGTSMGLSSLGDGYINFGVTGGIIFMLVLGLLYNWVLQMFYRQSFYYPILMLFVPLVFYYPIRPDCELQTSLGHLVKSCMLIYALVIFWKRDIMRIRTRKEEKKAPVSYDVTS